MKRNGTFITCWILAVMLWLCACDSNRNIEPPYESHFIKYLGTDENEKGVDMLLLPDQTLLLLGKAELAGTPKRIYLAKVDLNGDLLWEKYLGNATDVAKDIEPLSNGNFVILSDYEVAPGNTDIKLIRIDPQGNQLDSVVYNFPRKQISKSVTPLIDGGFVITGVTEQTGRIVKPPQPIPDVSDFFHFRCNVNLALDTINWDDQYGPGTLDGGSKVFQFSANEFYVFGHSNQPQSDLRVLKTVLQYYLIGSGGSINDKPNSLGNITEHTETSYVMQTPQLFGGGYFIIGTRTSMTGTMGLHVAKLRAPLQFDSEDIQLDKDIALGIGTNPITAVSAAPSVVGSQGYLLLANETRANGSDNISLSKINQTGDVLWYVSLGSEEKNDQAAAVIELPDGRIMVLGSVGIGDQSKMALFKLNSAGQLMN